MSTRDELHPIYLALFIIGGLCTGAGIVNLYWSFGRESDLSLNQELAVVGFSGLDGDIAMLPAADFSIPLLCIGVCCLVIANATAWKETDGY